MTNNQSALCERSRIIFDRLQAGELITPDDTHTLIGLCANYNNLCEAQTLATTRADNAQTLLAQAQTTIAQLRLNLSEAEQMFEGEHAQRKHLQGELSRTQAAHHALLSGAA